MEKLIIVGLLVVATAMEAGGDAIIRMGLNQPATGLRVAQFLAGAALLFGYGLVLNLAPLEFGRVIGIYVATLFIVWQVINFAAFGSLPSPPILVGGCSSSWGASSSRSRARCNSLFRNITRRGGSRACAGFQRAEPPPERLDLVRARSLGAAGHDPPAAPHQRLDRSPGRDRSMQCRRGRAGAVG